MLIKSSFSWPLTSALPPDQVNQEGGHFDLETEWPMLHVGEKNNQPPPLLWRQETEVLGSESLWTYFMTAIYTSLLFLGFTKQFYSFFFFFWTFPSKQKEYPYDSGS